MSTLNQYRYRASTRVPTRMRPRDGLRERDRLRERLPPLTLMREASTWLCLSPSSCVELK